MIPASFVAPGLAAAALAAATLPVLVHLLLRRRRVPVEWAAMDLLREAIRRVERRRRVERWALLALRCALVACAGLAIAGPLFGTAASVAGRRPRTLVAVIDDSAPSAEALGRGTALGRSVDAVRAAIEVLAEGDRVAVLTSTGFAQVGDASPSLDRRSALERIRSIAPRPLAGDLAAAVTAAVGIAGGPGLEGTDREVLVASSFRAGSLRSMDAPERSSGVRVVATRPATPEGANLCVESVVPERVPGAVTGLQSVLVTVARDRGEGTASTTVRVEGPTLSVPVARQVTLAAGERTRTVRVPVAERPHGSGGRPIRAVTAAITPDAQPLDDARHAVLPPTERLRAVVVDRRAFDPAAGIDRLPAGDWVSRALAPAEPAEIDVVTVDPAALDARALAGADCAVLLQPRQATPAQWAALRSFVEAGGSLVVTPMSGERAQAWTDAFTRAFGIPWRIGIEAEEFDPPVPLAEEQPEGGFLSALDGEVSRLAPAVEAFRLLPVDPSPDVGAVQVALRDGRPFLLSWDIPSGGSVSLLASAVDLSWTTLPLKPLMVPMWQELVASGRARSAGAMSFAPGVRARIRIPGAVELRPAPGGDGRREARTIPVASGGVTPALEVTGILEAVDSSGTVRGEVAVNPDVASCSVRPLAEERVASWLSRFGPFSWSGDEAGSGAPPGDAGAAPGTPPGSSIQLAPWLLAVSLALALGESALSRRFSHAVRRTMPGVGT